MAKKQKTEEANGHDAAPSGTQSIKIDGIIFTAPAPYAEGHVCNANEARTLNQTYGENLRNNFAKKVKTAKEEAEKAGVAVDVAALQASFDTYAQHYEFGAKRVGTRAPVDPVEKEAYKLAKQKLVESLKAKNVDPKSIEADQLEGYIMQLLEKNPAYRAEAARRVAAAQSIVADALELGA